MINLNINININQKLNLSLFIKAGLVPRVWLSPLWVSTWGPVWACVGVTALSLPGHLDGDHKRLYDDRLRYTLYWTLLTNNRLGLNTDKDIFSYLFCVVIVAILY